MALCLVYSRSITRQVSDSSYWPPCWALLRIERIAPLETLAKPMAFARS